MYIQLEDLNMYYYDNKRSNCPALIFIHGLGENLDSWQAQIDFFQDNYRVIAMDLRGHCRSGDGDKEISISCFANDIISLCDKLALTKVHLIGLSMGGIIAQQLAVMYPERLLSLSLCNTASYVSEESAGKLDERMLMIEQASMNDIANFIVSACLSGGYPPELYTKAFNIFRQNRKKPYLAATRATFSIDYRPYLPKITTPSLILTGELDKVTPPKASQFMHEQIKNSELCILPNTGHLSKMEQPELFNQAVHGFILRHTL